MEVAAESSERRLSSAIEANAKKGIQLDALLQAISDSAV